MRKFPNIDLIKHKTALEQLRELGTVVKINTERPCYADNYTHVYLVHFGLVDVFYLKRDDDGRIHSPRVHLQTVERNQLLMPLGGTLPDGTHIHLLAASSRAELLSIEKERFISFLVQYNQDKELLEMIAIWAKAMLEGMQLHTAPRDCLACKAGASLKLSEGNSLYSSHELVWAKLHKGTVYYAGHATLVLPEGSIFPLSQHGWVQAKEDCQLQIFHWEALPETDALTEGLLRTASLRSQALIVQSEASSERNKALLQEQVVADFADIEQASMRFASILERNRVHQADAKDHLAFTCQLIGKELGIEVEVPANLELFEKPLDAIAEHSKLRKRVVMLRDDWWLQENGHLLAFTEDDLPVALIQKNGHYVATQAIDKKSIRVTETYAQTLKPTAYMFFKPFNETITSVRKLWNFATQGLGADVVLMGLVAFTGAMLGLVTPVLMGILMDDIIPLSDTDYLLETISVMAVLAVVAALLGLAQAIFIIRIETKGTMNTQAALMDHLLRLPASFFKRFTSGDLANRALSINKIRQILSQSVIQVLLKGSFSVINLGLLFYYDSRLALAGVGLAGVALGIVGWIGYRKLRYNRNMAEIQGKVQGTLFEFLSAMVKIKSTGIEARVYAIWSRYFAQQKEVAFKTVAQQNKLHIFSNAFPLFTNIVFFFFIYFQFQMAGKEVEETLGMPQGIAHQLAFSSKEVGISVGAFLAFITAFRQFLTNSLTMGELLTESLEIVPQYERLRPLLEEPYESDDKAVAKPLQGGIELSHLKFRYEKDGAYILNNLSLHIEPNQLVAFVGESGSGKSTLMRLLLGFETPESGAIYYDGQDLAHLKLSSVRNQIGVVLQDGALSPASIYDNIIGTHNLTLDDAWEAARKVGLDEDIRQMPMQMNTILGEGASSLSGGQRQRLMIARAIVHKPCILFFDEATSALDNHTQKIVTQNMEQLKATRVVIAHRLSTVQNADKIFVLQKGVITESGTYDELMSNYGYFYELAQRQTM